VKPPAARSRRSLWAVFAIPLALATVTIVGLVAGLTGEGAPDLLAWLFLAIPILVLAVAWVRRT
jgi:hypothetical protein